MPFSEFNYRRSRNLMKMTIDIFRTAGIPVAREKCREFATEFVEELTERIERQQFHHVPLSPEYLRAKIEAGHDPRILIATQEYLNSIQVEPLPESDGFRVGVGDQVHESGVPMRQLARGHEFGTSRMPARPHWRPMASLYRSRSREMAAEIGQSVVRSFNEAIRRRQR